MTRTFECDLKQELKNPASAKMFGAAQAKSSFAITLAKARKALGITQQELAHRAGVSQAYIAKLEGGEANPTLERIGSLLAMIGLSLITDTATLSPYSVTPVVELNWALDPLLIQPSEGVLFVTDATNGIGSNYTERGKVKVV
jgi:transcriptional regulator with XRE-family HTH domain